MDIESSLPAGRNMERINRKTEILLNFDLVYVNKDNNQDGNTSSISDKYGIILDHRWADFTVGKSPLDAQKDSDNDNHTSSSSLASSSYNKPSENMSMTILNNSKNTQTENHAHSAQKDTSPTTHNAQLKKFVRSIIDDSIAQKAGIKEGKKDVNEMSQYDSSNLH